VRDFFTNQSGYDIMLSPWIMAHFNVIAVIVLFVWFALIRIAYNIDFLGLGNKPFIRFLYWFFVVLVSLALLGYSILFGATRYFDGMHEVASALSPNGRHRAAVLRSTWVQITYDVVDESNDPTPPFSYHVPFLSQEIGGVSFTNNDPTGQPRLVWTQDSQIVTLWLGSSPMFGYNFTTQTVIDPTRNPDLFRNLQGQ
jgi:hypothetical protein